MWRWWGHQRGHAHQPDVTRFWHLILVLFKVLASWSQFTRNPVHSAHFPLQEKKLWGQRLINRKSDCTGQEEDWNLLQLPNRFLSSTRFGITNSAMWADFTRFQSGTCLILMLRRLCTDPVSFQSDIDWPNCFFDLRKASTYSISVTVTSSSLAKLMCVRNKHRSKVPEISWATDEVILDIESITDPSQLRLCLWRKADSDESRTNEDFPKAKLNQAPVPGCSWMWEAAPREKAALSNICRTAAPGLLLHADEAPADLHQDTKDNVCRINVGGSVRKRNLFVMEQAVRGEYKHDAYQPVRRGNGAFHFQHN